MKNSNKLQYETPVKKTCILKKSNQHAYSKPIEYPEFKLESDPYTETSNIIDSFESIHKNKDMFGKTPILLTELYNAIFEYEQNKYTFLERFNNLCYSYAHYRLTDSLNYYYEMQSISSLNGRAHILLILGESGVGKSTLLKTFSHMSTKNNPDSFVMVEFEPDKSIGSDYQGALVDLLKIELGETTVGDLNKELEERLCLWVSDEFSHTSHLIKKDIQLIKKLFECIDEKASFETKYDTNCQIPAFCLLLMTNDTKEMIDFTLLEQQQEIPIYERMITLDLFSLFGKINNIITENGIQVPQEFINKWKYLNETIQLMEMKFVNKEGQWEPDVENLDEFSMSKFLNVTPIQIGIEWIKEKIILMQKQNISIEQKEVFDTIRNLDNFDNNNIFSQLTSLENMKGKYDLLNYIWKEFQTDIYQSGEFLFQEQSKTRFFKYGNNFIDLNNTFTELVKETNPTTMINKINVKEFDYFEKIIDYRNTCENNSNQIIHKYREGIVEKIQENKKILLSDQDCLFTTFILKQYPNVSVIDNVEEFDIFIIRVLIYYQHSNIPVLIQWMFEVLVVELITIFNYEYESVIVEFEEDNESVKNQLTQDLLTIQTEIKSWDFIENILLQLFESTIVKCEEELMDQVDLSIVIDELEKTKLNIQKPFFENEIGKSPYIHQFSFLTTMPSYEFTQMLIDKEDDVDKLMYQFDMLINKTEKLVKDLNQDQENGETINIIEEKIDKIINRLEAIKSKNN